MSNPLVSVVIPAYNAAAYLPETIKSVQTQTFQDFEVLVVNDGSVDKTSECVAGFTDSRIKLINQANQGCAAARNTGLDASQGRYVAFLDSDDLWETTKLEKQVKCLEENSEIGLVYSWVDFSDADGNPTGKVRKVFAEGNVFKQMIVGNLISCGSVPLVRRVCFEAVGLFDTNLWTAEDKDMWLRISAHYPFALIKEPLVYYRQHSNSKSSKGFRRREQDFQRIMSKLPESLLVEGSLEWKKVYSQQYLYFAWRAYEGKSYRECFKYLLDAARFHPLSLFSKEFIHLSSLLSVKTLMGESSYRKLRRLIIGSSKHCNHLLKRQL